MTQKLFFRSFVTLAITASWLLIPVAGSATQSEPSLGKKNVEQVTESKTQALGVLEGRVLGKSNKAKIIALLTADKVEMIRFDQQTTGIEYAAKGEVAIIRSQDSASGKLAIDIIPKPALLPQGVEDIEPDELAELIGDDQTGNYLLVDARSARRYQLGHIPSAISIPLPELQEKKNSLSSLAGMDSTVVFYSDGPTCGLCTEAARLASEQGYTRVMVMLAGAQGWESEEGLLAVSDTFVEKGKAVLVDVRQQTQAARGHIPGAVNVPAQDLVDAEYDFPVKKSAPIVLYGKDSETEEAQEVIKGWGYKRVLLVDGGLEGWQRRGGPLAPGAAKGSEAISWTMQPEENQVSVREFKKVAASPPGDPIILDVRTAKEAAAGKLKNSLHIPLEELAARLDEIPVGKEILTHCISGSRAEMAAIFLDQYVDQVRYLPAKVRCKGEKCRIK